MVRSKYVQIQRRRRSGKTNFKRRSTLLQSRETILAVRISNKTTFIQFLTPLIGGDRTESSSHSSQLIKLGWTGSGKSLPGAYLTGYLAGRKAGKVGVKRAIPYLGTRKFTAGSKVVASLKGVVDAGVQVPIDKDVLPDPGRLRGEHIAKFASALESDSIILGKRKKAGYDPSRFAEEIDEMKVKIDAEVGDQK